MQSCRRGATTATVDTWSKAQEHVTNHDLDGLLIVSKQAASSDGAAAGLEGAFETVRLLANRRSGEMDGVSLVLAAPSQGVFDATG